MWRWIAGCNPTTYVVESYLGKILVPAGWHKNSVPPAAERRQLLPPRFHLLPLRPATTRLSPLITPAAETPVWHSKCVQSGRKPESHGGATVLWTIFVILLIAWLLGLTGVYQIGSLVWLLFVAAVVALVIQLATGRRTIV